MKIAFVAGFYDSVKKTLDISYSAHQANGSLVWVRQRELHREADLAELSSRFFDAAESAEFVRMILHVPRGREWAKTSVEGILKNSTVKSDIVSFDNDGDCDGVLRTIRDFGLAAPSDVERACVRSQNPKR